MLGEVRLGFCPFVSSKEKTTFLKDFHQLTFFFEDLANFGEQFGHGDVEVVVRLGVGAGLASRRRRKTFFNRQKLGGEFI
jgi:hypothetical protein